jgi:hypothetical protein
MRKLTIADLRTSALDKARLGFSPSDQGSSGNGFAAPGITYAQAAQRAAAEADHTDVEQLARWWVKARLESATLLTSDWCGEPTDLPEEVEEDFAEQVVERATELWSDVVFESFREGMRASRAN